MTLRRLPPLAIALALVAAALVATVIATRHSVNDAFATVGDGQAIAEELDVRADLSDLDGPPTRRSSTRSSRRIAKRACATSRSSTAART